MATFDIILSTNGFEEVDGDFKAGDNANNLLNYIVIANKGEYKEFPLLGVGIDRYLNTSLNVQQIETNIIKELKSDVFLDPDVDMIDFEENNIISINKEIFELVS